MWNIPEVDIKKLKGWQVAGLLVMAPLMGAAFVIFLPFAGFVIVGKALVEKAIAIMRDRYKQLKHFAGVV